MRAAPLVLGALLLALPADARWLADCSQAPPPARRVAGRIHGRTFQPNRTELLLQPARPGVRRSTYVLSLRQIANSRAVLECTLTLITPRGQSLAGKSFVVGPAGPFKMPGMIREGTSRMPPVQGVSIRWSVPGRNASKAFAGPRYTMRLQFGRTAAGRLPGTVYLCLRDPERSWVAGSFSAVARPLK